MYLPSILFFLSVGLDFGGSLVDRVVTERGAELPENVVNNGCLLHFQ